MNLTSLLALRGKVRVTNAKNDDHSTIYVSKGTLQSLKLSHGDVVHVRGRNRKVTVLIILADEEMDDGNARMAAIARCNLDVSDGDKIFIMACQDIKSAKIISVMAITDTEDINATLETLEMYFDETYRPVYQGNKLALSDDTIQAKVIRVEPHPYGIVTEDTMIHCTTGPVEIEKGNFNKAKLHESFGVQIAWIRSLFRGLKKSKNFTLRMNSRSC